MSLIFSPPSDKSTRSTRPIRPLHESRGTVSSSTRVGNRVTWAKDLVLEPSAQDDLEIMRKQIWLVPLQFAEPSLEERYFKVTHATFPARARIIGLIGLGIGVAFWVTISVALGKERLLTFSDLQTTLFHVMNAFCLFCLAIIAVVDRVPVLKRNMEVSIYASIACVFFAKFSWLVYCALAVRHRKLGLLFLEEAQFKKWTDVYLMTSYLLSLIAINLVFQSRTKISWLIHLFQSSTLVTCYSVEIAAFDDNVYLSFITYLQILMIICTCSLAYFGRYYKELHERVEFLRLELRTQQLERAKEALQPRGRVKHVSTAVEDVINMLLKCSINLSGSEVSPSSETATLIKESIHLLSHSDDLFTVRVKDSSNGEVQDSANIKDFINAFAPEPKLRTRQKSKVRFADDTEISHCVGGLTQRSSSLKTDVSLHSTAPPRYTRLSESCTQDLSNRAKLSGIELYDDIAYKVGLEWPFDISSLETPNVLKEVGFALLTKHLGGLRVCEEVLVSFLTSLQSKYYDNPYHNQVHGATVAHSSICLNSMLQLRFVSLCSSW